MARTSSLPADLLDGYARFRTGRYAAERERYERLAEDGQRPSTLVVACSDSRSAPEVVFDAGPGELFVVRNVAGLVPTYAPDGTSHGVSAALEYAVLALEVRSIVVLGHGRCGGIAAALDPAARLSSTDFVGAWVSDLRRLAADLQAAGELPDEPGSRRLVLERRSVERSIANLGTFPWVREREGAGRLHLHGAWFDVGWGELHGLGPDGWCAVEAGPA